MLNVEIKTCNVLKISENKVTPPRSANLDVSKEDVILKSSEWARFFPSDTTIIACFNDVSQSQD